MNRRQFLSAAVGAAGLPLAACGRHVSSQRCPGPRTDFETLQEAGSTLLRIGPASGRVVVLLHELPGLSPDDLALARCISHEGFNVYAPLLFGEPWQNDFVRGYSQACGSKRFACEALEARSAILDTLEPLCDRLAARAGGPIGAIGMCLTGVLPLALLAHGVGAAVLCQPTLPFTPLKGRPDGRQIEDLGLGAADREEAVKAATPFLAMHYTGDSRCPPGRMRALQRTFADGMALIELAGSHHSTLAGDLDQNAFADAIAYLKVRLGVEAGPRAMSVARLAGRRCEITAAGRWRALET